MFNYMGMTEQQVREGVNKFGPAVGARKVIDQEYLHAQESLQNGIYITYASNSSKGQPTECFRLGSTSKCFCGHQLGKHKQQFFSKKFNTSCETCPCKQFKFVPSRPEEVGMWWLVRRKDFNVTTWRPPCKCTHTCEEHNPNYPLRCQKCQCSDFTSYFACISCDRKWEDHEVIYETEQERKSLNKPIGSNYLPLNSNPDIQQEVFKNEKYQFEQYQDDQFNPNLRTLNKPVGNDKPFPITKPQTNSNNKQIAKKEPQYTTAYTRPRPISLNIKQSKK